MALAASFVRAIKCSVHNAHLLIFCSLGDAIVEVIVGVGDDDEVVVSFLAPSERWFGKGCYNSALPS